MEWADRAKSLSSPLRRARIANTVAASREIDRALLEVAAGRGPDVFLEVLQSELDRSQWRQVMAAADQVRACAAAATDTLRLAIVAQRFFPPEGLLELGLPARLGVALPMLGPENWREAAAIFHGVRGADAAFRDAFLTALAVGDPRRRAGTALLASLVALTPCDAASLAGAGPTFLRSAVEELLGRDPSLVRLDDVLDVVGDGAGVPGPEWLDLVRDILVRQLRRGMVPEAAERVLLTLVENQSVATSDVDRYVEAMVAAGSVAQAMAAAVRAAELGYPVTGSLVELTAVVPDGDLARLERLLDDLGAMSPTVELRRQVRAAQRHGRTDLAVALLEEGVRSGRTSGLELAGLVADGHGGAVAAVRRLAREGEAPQELLAACIDARARRAAEPSANPAAGPGDAVEMPDEGTPVVVELMEHLVRCGFDDGTCFLSLRDDASMASSVAEARQRLFDDGYLVHGLEQPIRWQDGTSTTTRARRRVMAFPSVPLPSEGSGFRIGADASGALHWLLASFVEDRSAEVPDLLVAQLGADHRGARLRGFSHMATEARSGGRDGSAYLARHDAMVLRELCADDAAMAAFARYLVDRRGPDGARVQALLADESVRLLFDGTPMDVRTIDAALRSSRRATRGAKSGSRATSAPSCRW